MRFMKFPGAIWAGAPKGWDQNLDGPVGSLPIAKRIDPLSGLTFNYSFWQPDADQLALLAAGGAIRLGCGGFQPIVNVCVVKPEIVAETELEAVDWADAK